IQIPTTLGNRSCVAPISLAPDKWQHITGVYMYGDSEVRLKMFIDGIKVCDNHYTGATAGSFETGKIRASSPTMPFSGLLDDAQLFNYVLTDEQVKLLHNGGAVSWE